MDGVISNSQMVLLHAQWDAQHVLDEQHNQTRHDNVQSNNKQRSHNLDPDLLSIPINRASRIRNTEGLATLHRCKDSSEETTEQTAHGVGVHVSKDVVDGEEGLGASENVHAEPGDGAGADADNEGAPAGDDTGGGGDGDEACDFAFDGTEDGGLLDWRGALVMVGWGGAGECLQYAMSRRVQTMEETAVQRLVLRTATPASGEAFALVSTYQGGFGCERAYSVWVTTVEAWKENMSVFVVNL